MQILWVTLGIIVLAATLLDLFLAALNYDESGFLSAPLINLQWRVLRSMTRRMSRRVRPVALRQVTGLQVLLTVVVWLGGVVLGFGLIYYGLMQGTNFVYDGAGMGPGPLAALFLSLAQLATVGTSQVTANNDVLRILTVGETLSGLVLVTMILTFVLGVYQVVRDLRAFSSTLFSPVRGAGDAVAGLAPYFPDGRPTGLDSHLQAIHDTFDSYTDGVRLHHAAYYFQSGRDQFSLAYSLGMLSGVIGGLRWGLPTGHPASTEPVLIPLYYKLERFREYLHGRLKWKSLDVPEVVPLEEFTRAVSDGEMQDRWVAEFLRLNLEMARLVKLGHPLDPAEAYERYRLWLPFAYRARQMTNAVSEDLDYQPITRVGALTLRGNTATATTGGTLPVRLQASGRFGDRPVLSAWRVFLNRWGEVPDPGLTRFRAALRAVLAAAVTVGTILLVFASDGNLALPPAIFGALIAMQTTLMAKDATIRSRQATTVLCVVPAVGGAALGAVVAHSFGLTTVVLVLVALIGVGIGRFGPRWAALGQLAFMTYYFSLLLHVPLGGFYRFAIAVALGIAWAYLFNFVILRERPEQVLRGGVDSLGGRLVQIMDPLIDAVSGARWDPDISNRVRTGLRQVHRGVAFLGGQLGAGGLSAGLSPERQGELRLRLFDTELAANNVAAAARHVTGAGIPVAIRARLAGLLELSQGQLRTLWSGELSMPPLNEAPAYPGQSSEAVRRLYSAMLELVRAAEVLRDVQVADLATQGTATDAGDLEVRVDEPALTAMAAPPAAGRTNPAGSKSLDPVSRRAIQAAVAAGAALLAGSWVSTTYQYWAALPAFQLVGSTDGETVLKGIQKIAGTVVGAATGFAVAIYSGSNPFVVLTGVFICLFATVYFGPVSAPVMSFFQTAMFALLYQILGKLSAQTLEIRIFETLVGAAVAVAAAGLLLPAKTGRKLTSEMVSFLRTLDAIASTSLHQLGGGGDHGPELSRQALALNGQLSQLYATAAPMRYSSGSLGRDGIERRLTAFSALTYYARHLVNAAQAPADTTRGASSIDWPLYSAVTEGNISALVSLLEKRVPDEMRDSQDLPEKPESSSSQASPALVGVRELQRINQTLLVLAEDLAPDPEGVDAPDAEPAPS